VGLAGLVPPVPARQLRVIGRAARTTAAAATAIPNQSRQLPPPRVLVVAVLPRLARLRACCRRPWQVGVDVSVRKNHITNRKESERTRVHLCGIVWTQTTSLTKLSPSMVSPSFFFSAPLRFTTLNSELIRYPHNMILIIQSLCSYAHLVIIAIVSPFASRHVINFGVITKTIQNIFPLHSEEFYHPLRVTKRKKRIKKQSPILQACARGNPAG
jgi:hypothetical protein